MKIKSIINENKAIKAEIGYKPYLEIGDIDVTSKEYILKDKGAVKGAVIANKNDVLVSTVRPTRGAITILNEDDIVISNAFAILKTKETVCIPKYLFYALQNVNFLNYLGAKSKGATYPTCSKSDVLNYDIGAKRSISNQKSIIDIFDKLTTIITEKKQQLQEYDQLIKSRFVEIFGDPVENDKDWITCNVGDICVVTKLAGFEYTKYIEYKDSGEVIMVRGLNVKDKKLKLDNVYYISKEVSNKLERSQLKENDVVMTYVGVNIGDVALVDGLNHYHLAPNVAKISPNSLNELNPLFFVNLLAFNKVNFSRNATNTAKQALNMKKIRGLKVMLPPIHLQNQFAVFVKQVDKLKFEVQKSLDETQTLFDSLMQEYFG